jgi:hypothetical protein
MNRFNLQGNSKRVARPDVGAAAGGIHWRKFSQSAWRHAANSNPIWPFARSCRFVEAQSDPAFIAC